MKIFPYNKELYSKVLEYYNNEKLSSIIIDIRTDKHDTGDFFNRGFEKRFSASEMEHNGRKVESDLQVVNYEEKYYEIYKDAFFEMRKALNLNPYRDYYKPEELMERKFCY